MIEAKIGPKPRRSWTRATAIQALRLEAKCLQRTPSERDMRQRDALCASEKTYRKMFGTIVAAQAAAGLRPNIQGRNTGWRKEKCRRGHPRIPVNIDTQGHCRLCASFWAHRRGRGPMWPRSKGRTSAANRQAELQRYWGMA